MFGMYHKPTAGAAALTYAYLNCKRVHLFGFAHTSLEALQGISLYHEGYVRAPSLGKRCELRGSLK